MTSAHKQIRNAQDAVLRTVAAAKRQRERDQKTIKTEVKKYDEKWRKHLEFYRAELKKANAELKRLKARVLELEAM